MIPGWIISLLTFPGVILHEFSHKLFCNLFHVPVYRVKYFQIGTSEAGYVQHGEPRTFAQTFWISTGPLVINSLCAVILAGLSIQARGDSFLQYLIVWLSASAGMHAFPSSHDAEHILSASKIARAKNGSVLYLLAYPFVELIDMANGLRIFWFDAFYAAGLFYLGKSIIST